VLLDEKQLPMIFEVWWDTIRMMVVEGGVWSLYTLGVRSDKTCSSDVDQIAIMTFYQYKLGYVD
jgi:hypothetical protein